MPLYTPISGSWLNMAESVQRILVRRALDGQHPQSQDDLIAWLDDTVAGWNANPTPFAWHGKRFERRQRARQRRLGGEPYNEYIGIESGIGHGATDDELVHRLKVTGASGGAPATIARTSISERSNSK